MAVKQTPAGGTEGDVAPRTGAAASERGLTEEPEEVLDDVALLTAPEIVASTLGDFLSMWWRRVRGGESGMLPVFGALAAIIVIFQVQSSLFLSAGNLVNLFIQAAVIVLLGIGEVFVLLLGEIDLSVGFVAGIGGGLMAALVAPPFNVPWWVAILAALGGTTTIGFIQGTLITRLRLPSFIVTLAGLIGWEGVMIWMFNHLSVAVGGVISVSDPHIGDLANGNLSPAAGWIVMAALVVGFGSLTIFRDARRRAAGLAASPLSVTALKVLLAAVAGVLLVMICNTNRGIHSTTLHTVTEGVPWAIVIILGVVLVTSFVLARTRFGRYLYAIGGNAEAARRAGINLVWVRTIAFALSGLMAGIAGVIYTSWLRSMATDIDGGNYVLYAVAAAVIGGASLYGGRGKPLYALLGGLVIAAIANGLALIGAGAAPTYMVTALVLIVAITVDSVARRGQAASARGKV
jgi:D-xylose transport system permease protein